MVSAGQLLPAVLYQPPLMLTHEEWVSVGWYGSVFVGRSPTRTLSRNVPPGS
jgi:hypothetical protein